MSEAYDGRGCKACEDNECCKEHCPEIARLTRRIERLEGIIAQAAPLAWVHTDDLDGAAEWEREAKRALDEEE